MSQRPYIACHHAVSEQHGNPPNSFLDQLIDAISPLPDNVFERNDRHDIYSVMLGALGPYTDLLHRKAVMCEVLRVQAGFESDWNWNEGVDVNNTNSLAHRSGEETGAFQVSWDSMGLDASLSECLDSRTGAHDVDTFIQKMKSNHALAVEYCARLLRFNTTWCGTINDASKVIAHVRRDAVAEFRTFLQPSGSSNGLASNASATPLALGASGASTSAAPGNSDSGRIAKLIQIASDPSGLASVQSRAAAALLEYDGEVYPHDGCAITLSILLRDAGIDVPPTYQAITLGSQLKQSRQWQVIPLGQQQAGDIGSTCGPTPDPGADHIYLVLKRVNSDEMVVADNQATEPHFRFVSGQGRTPTKFFLRAV